MLKCCRYYSFSPNQSKLSDLDIYKLLHYYMRLCIRVESGGLGSTKQASYLLLPLGYTITHVIAITENLLSMVIRLYTRSGNLVYREIKATL